MMLSIASRDRSIDAGCAMWRLSSLRCSKEKRFIDQAEIFGRLCRRKDVANEVV
jgi:hypothetical protein